MADSEIQILIKAVDEVTSTMKSIEKKLDISNKGIQKQTEETTKTFQDQTANILILGQAANSVDRIFDSYQNMQYRIENATERVSGATDNLTNAQIELNKVMKSGTASAEDIANAQRKVESASRTLLIAQNRLAVTQNQVIGTYIGMGMQGVTLIASFKKVKTAVTEMTIASYKFIATPLGAALAALGIIIAIVTTNIHKQRQEEEDLLAATNELADGKYTLLQIEKNYASQIQQINIDADKELLQVQKSLKDTTEELADSKYDLVQIEKDYGTQIQQINISADKELLQIQSDLKNKTNELGIAEGELLVIQAKISDETDNWAEALEGVDKYIKRFIIPQTEAEAQSLVELQDQEHIVNLAKLSGDDLVIQSEEYKLTQMKLVHQANFDDVRDKTLAELNLLEVKTATEKGLMDETQNLYQVGYNNISSYLEGIYYPKLQEMWQSSIDAELKSQRDKADEIIKINDEITSLNIKATEVESDRLNAIKEAAESNNRNIQEATDKITKINDEITSLNDKTIEIKTTQATSIKTATDEYNTQKTTIEDRNKEIETSVIPGIKNAAEAPLGTGLSNTITNLFNKLGDLLLSPFGVKAGYDIKGNKIPTYQEGGYVPDTGMALLHKGEYVMSASDVGNGNQQSNLTIIIEGDNYGIDAEQIAQSLASKFNSQIRI